MKINDLLLRTLSGEKTERTPVWFMRQAGRSLSEYKQIREKIDFLSLCKTPDLAAEVTIQPVDILGVDAAILFSDILIPIEALGVNIVFDPSPVILDPIRNIQQVNNLGDIAPEEDVSFVYETIDILVSKLKVPLIGFAGAPFTLACYMVEGGGSKNFLEIKKFMYGDEKGYSMLMNKLTDCVLKYLQAQIDHGCSVVQLFDTWGGILAPKDYSHYVFPYVKYIMDNLKGAFTVYFVRGVSNYLEVIKKLTCSAIGVDWGIDISEANKRLDSRFVLQGNLDPAILLADVDIIKYHASGILEDAKDIKGHIFNLGHGVYPETPVDSIKELVRFVKKKSAR